MGCGSRSCGPRRARAPKANGSTTSTRREYCTLLFAEGHTVYVCIVAAREKDRLRDISLYRCLSACSLPVLPQEIRCILFESRTLSANRSRGVNNGQKHAGAGGSGARQLHRVHGVGAHRYRGWRRVWGPDRQSELRRVHECTQGGFVQAVLLRVVQCISGCGPVPTVQDRRRSF